MNGGWGFRLRQYSSATPVLPPLGHLLQEDFEKSEKICPKRSTFYVLSCYRPGARQNRARSSPNNYGPFGERYLQ